MWSRRTIGQMRDAAVRELRARTDADATPAQQLHPRIEPDPAERDDDPGARERADLGLEMLEAAAADSGRRIALRELRGQPLDHPEILTIPETGYIKGALLEALD